MTVLLMTDLEGISGVDSIEMMEGEGYVLKLPRVTSAVSNTKRMIVAIWLI